MINTKVRVGVIYHKNNQFLTGNHLDNTYYNFFVKAFQRNPNIDVVYYPTDDVFDATILKNKVDAVLLWSNAAFGMPNKIYGLEKLSLPVIARAGDPEDAKESLSRHDEWKIDHYFHFIPESYFYKLYPKSFKYKKIIFGLESELYLNVVPFKNRIKNRILNSGNAGKNTFINKLICYIRDRSTRNPYIGYKLRTMCNKLSYVDYTPSLNHKYINDEYPNLLQKYASAIAATSDTPSIKYFEIPAAGCLTFMEITEKNRGNYLGYTDGKNAIFINEKNYKKKFEEYLSDTDNPKWEEIAQEGRKYALVNFNNDQAVSSLVKLISELTR